MRGALYNGLNLTPLSLISVGWYGLGGRGFCDGRGFVQWLWSDSTRIDQYGPGCCLGRRSLLGWAGLLLSDLALAPLQLASMDRDNN